MVDAVLSTVDLLRTTGYKSAGALRRSLDQQGVPYFLGKDGPWTTLALIAAAKLQAPASKDADRFSPAML